MLCLLFCLLLIWYMFQPGKALTVHSSCSYIAEIVVQANHLYISYVVSGVKCTLTKKFVQLPNGIKIWTVIANREARNKIPLVMVHGFGAGVGFWVSKLLLSRIVITKWVIYLNLWLLLSWVPTWKLPRQLHISKWWKKSKLT